MTTVSKTPMAAYPQTEKRRFIKMDGKEYQQQAQLAQNQLKGSPKKTLK